MTTVYLAHHGIKGQKWGVRRYQNADGSLTPRGRKKYSKKAESLERQARNHENEAGKLDSQKGILSKVGAVSGGAVGGSAVYFVAAMASLPVAPVGYGIAAGAAVGSAATKAMYAAASKHQMKLANKKYSEAAEYRKLLNG